MNKRATYGRKWPHSGQMWSMSAQIRPDWADSWPALLLVSDKFGQCWPVPELGRNWSTAGSMSAQIRPGVCGRIRRARASMHSENLRGPRSQKPLERCRVCKRAGLLPPGAGRKEIGALWSSHRGAAGRISGLCGGLSDAPSSTSARSASRSPKRRECSCCAACRNASCPTARGPRR